MMKKQTAITYGAPLPGDNLGTRNGGRFVHRAARVLRGNPGSGV
jgi:hypothetical protein